MLETQETRIQKDLEALAAFTATPGAGMTRFAFTEEDRLTREYLAGRMKDAGLTVFEDNAGNLFGRREGTNPDAPALMIGSHYDSVRHGGIFDGPAGVVAALEIARVLHENFIETEHPLEIAALIEEEGGRFGGGFYGSRAMTGQIDREYLGNFKDVDGVSVAEALEAFGFDPGQVSRAARSAGSLRAFLELHIEQGPVLERDSTEIGIVDVIVGMTQKEVEIRGRADHAGTTPMAMRANALLAAMEGGIFLDRAAREAGGGTVGTVGRMEVFPGGTNIVPGRAVFSIDVRSADMAKVDGVVRSFEAFLGDLEEKHGVTAVVTEKVTVQPAKMSCEIMALFEKEAKGRSYSHKVMVSGAGHDSMIMAAITPAAMVFVPSKGGRSHCPEEWTDFSQIKKGADVMLGAVLALAKGSK